MAETKYQKNFISGIPDKLKGEENQEAGPGKMLLYTNGEYNPGVNFFATGWLSQEGIDRRIHNHSHDEYMGYFGSDAEHPEELNGEIEYTLGGEKHTITKSCVIFIPAGVFQGPIKIKKVIKPIFWFATTPTTSCIFENLEIYQD